MLKLSKKRICISLISCLVMGLISCGKTEESGSTITDTTGSNYVAEPSFETAEGVFCLDKAFKLEGVKGWIAKVSMSEDSLYFYTDENVVSDDSPASPTDVMSTKTDAVKKDSYNIIRFYKASKSGGSAELLADIKIKNKSYIDSLLLDKDSNIYVTETKWTKDERSKTNLLKLKDGKLTDEINISDITDVSADSWFSELFMNREGNLVAVYDKAVKLYDKELNELAGIKLENYIEASGVSKDGYILVAQTEIKNGDNVVTVKAYDNDSSETVGEYTVSARYINRLYTGNGDYDFYYQAGDGIYGYKISDLTETRIVDFANSELDVDQSGEIYMDGGDRLYTLSRSDDGNTLTSYKRTDTEPVSSRKVLTLLSQSGSEGLKQQITDYNNSQTKVEIKLLDYSDTENVAQKVDDELEAGRLPDIYEFSGQIGSMPVDLCIKKGMFTDLSDMINSDRDFGMEDLIPAAAYSLTYDNKVYYISPSFTVSSLVADVSEVGEEAGWTYDEFKDYVTSKNGKTVIFRANNKTDILKTLLRNTMGDFVNLSKGEVYFDSLEFRSVLEACNKGVSTDVNYSEDTMSEPDMIKNKNLVFLHGEITPEMLQIYDDLYQGNVCFKGFPSSEGVGLKLKYSDMYAISDTCSDKEAAWDFIKQFMTQQYRGRMIPGLRGVPTRQDVYQQYIVDKQTTEQIKDSYGNVISPISGGYGWDNVEFELKPLTAEEADRYNSLIDEINGSIIEAPELMDIIVEESERYFNEEQSLDDTVILIQKRVTEYIESNS